MSFNDQIQSNMTEFLFIDNQETNGQDDKTTVCVSSTIKFNQVRPSSTIHICTITKPIVSLVNVHSVWIAKMRLLQQAK